MPSTGTVRHTILLDAFIYSVSLGKRIDVWLNNEKYENKSWEDGEILNVMLYERGGEFGGGQRSVIKQ